MAGKQSSEVKRRTASTRKTTTTRKSSAGKKRNTSGKSANTKASRMQVSEYTEPVGDEIKLIIILAVSILILLSVFGLGGRVGDKAAYLFFGLFGFVAYALPFLLFIGSAFHISNRGSRLARIKLTAATVFLIMIMALMALADSSFDGTASVLDGFLNSAAAHNGGGLIGFSLSWVLFNAFGRAGSTVILVCLMLVSGVLITGKRIFIRLGTLIGHMMPANVLPVWKRRQLKKTACLRMKHMKILMKKPFPYSLRKRQPISLSRQGKRKMSSPRILHRHLHQNPFCRLIPKSQLHPLRQRSFLTIPNSRPLTVLIRDSLSSRCIFRFLNL